MPNPSKIKGMPQIPVQLTQADFEEFILDQLPKKISGPKYKLSRYKMFNYVLKFIYMGCQWKMLPIDKDKTSRPEIHYTQIFRTYQSWLECGAIIKIFENSVFVLHETGRLDASTIHRDGTITMAKKGGDCLGFSGYKHMKGEKIVAFCDRHCNVLSPILIAPGNRHQGPLFEGAFEFLKDIFKWVSLSKEA